MSQSTVTLTSGMAFDTEVDGHTFTIDAAATHGGSGSGPMPKTLMLSALAGCAGMDIIAILRKMRNEPEILAVKASGDLTDTHPKVFEDLHVTVRVTGTTEPKKLWKAVALSRDRYCGVAEMIRAHAPIAYSVELNGEPLPEPA
jgi:putative redox protein